MADRVGDWLEVVEQLYPAADAQDWDSVGLQVGAPDDEVDAVLVCLDITTATLDEAEAVGAQLLLAHHPLLFRPLARLTPATAAGALALRAARSGVAVAAAHTNLDAATDGTTAPVMELLGIRDAVPLVGARLSGGASKLVVFVPIEATGTVLAAAFSAGAGRIGEYDECSFRVTGVGTFRPSGEADPVLGERGRRNEVDEERVEVLVAESRLASVVEAVVAAHPYEEVALDLHPLRPNPVEPGARKGLGRVGDLSRPMTVGEIADRLHKDLPSPHLRMAGDPDRRVTRVAACGGAGDSLIGAAQAAGAELYITGDLRHHPALDAVSQGLALIDAGHHATEAPALKAFQDRLTVAARDRGLQARLLASERSTDPWIAAPWADQEERRA